MKARRTFGGFAAGVLLGTLFGSSAVALASFGYKGWQKFSYDFKGGYIAGFLDMALLARNIDPGGYVDIRYPEVTKANINDWYAAVDDFYKDPKNQEYTIASAMQAAAFRLKAKFGVTQTPEQRTLAKMEQQLAALKRKKAEEAAKNGGATNADSVASVPSKAPVTAPGKAAAPVPEGARPKRKWCRCDGVDPVKARAERQAAAAAAGDDDEDDDAPPPKKPAAVAAPPVIKTVPVPAAPDAAEPGADKPAKAPAASDKAAPRAPAK